MPYFGYFPTKTIDLRIKIMIDVVDVFWAVVHNNFSFEWFRICESILITKSSISVFLMISFLFFLFEITNI